MKSIKYLKLFLMTLALGLVTTSCMDDDWKDPTGDTPAFGNNNLVETNVVSIAKLKEMYDLTPATVNSHINDTMRIADGLQIKGVVTGHDIEGNIYNEIAVDDGSAGIIICIAQGGLCGQLQIGQEILIDLGGLYIGTYRSQPQIGVPYTSTSASGQKSTYPSRIARKRTCGRSTGKARQSRIFPYPRRQNSAACRRYRGSGILLRHIRRRRLAQGLYARGNHFQ